VYREKSRSRLPSRTWILPALTGLALLAGALTLPAGAQQDAVVEDGVLSIPLRGLPDPPAPKPPAAKPSGGASSGGATAGDRSAATGSGDYAQAVGRLGMTIAPWSEIYRQRDPRSQLLTRLPSNYHFAVKGERDGYYAVLMVDGSIGWIPTTSVRLLDFDVVADTRPDESPSFDPGAGTIGAAVIREAYRYLGVRYSWGGNGPRGIDCSGLVKNCFARLGYQLPRTASQQVLVGTPVAFSDLRPGDRLYFAVKGKRIDHTGIYITKGYFIHAAMSRGEVGVDHLSKPLYTRSLVAARRL